MPMSGSPTRNAIGMSTDMPIVVVKPGIAPMSMPSNSPALIQINVSTRKAASNPARSASINAATSHAHAP